MQTLSHKKICVLTQALNDLKLWHRDTKTKVQEVVGRKFNGKPVPTRTIDQIVKVVEVGTERGYKKVLDHLLEESTRRVPNPSGGWTDVTETTVHAPYLARRYWDVSNRGSLADPSNPTDIRLMFGRPPDFTLTCSYTKFLSMLDTGSLGIPVPVRVVGADGSEHAMSIIKFWRQCLVHTEPVVRIIGREAIRGTSIAISQTPAEQSLAVLSNHQQSNRLAGGSRYASNLLNLTCNQALLWKVLGAQAEAVKKKTGRR